MTWIIASLIMFISSVIMYLLVRKAQSLKITNSIVNIAMFLVPCPIYLTLMINQHRSFGIGTFNLFTIFLAAFFFSYLGNVFSLKSIKMASNPGYSLIISKSYVVFTSIASIFLFQAPLTLKNSIAIGLIVGFSALIMINKQRQINKTIKNNNTGWLIYAFGAFFAWGGLALASKYWLNIGIPITSRLFYLSMMVSAMIGSEIIITKQSLKLNKISLLFILGIGILAMFFNLFMQIGYQYASNPGYINAVNASSISLVTLLAAFFFKDELNLQKIIGVLGVTGGLILLFI